MPPHLDTSPGLSATTRRRARPEAQQEQPTRSVRPSRAPRTVHGLAHYLANGDRATALTVPVIYSLLIPVVLLDAWLWLFQRLCFPVYGIPRVHRRAHVVLDRHRLPYLNAVERLNCAYCGYVNGVFGLAREVAARTEAYWCPIKHARQPRDTHRLYDRFAPHGDAAAFASLSARQWQRRARQGRPRVPHRRD